MKLLRVILAVTLVHPVPTFAVPVRPDPMRVGILPLGDSPSPRVARALGIAERRVSRWLENFRSMPTRVESVGALSPSAGANEAAEILADGARWATLKRSAAREAKLAALEGPALQEALLVEAIAAFAEKRGDDAREWLAKACAVHPAGKLVAFEGWDRDAPGFDLLAFESLVEKTSKEFVPQCRVEWEVTPPAAKIFVNGFPWTEKSLVALPQRALRVRAEAFGHLSETREIPCSKAGTTKVTLALAPGAAPHSSENLAALARRGKFESLFLIEAAGEDLKLFFFTPTQEVREVPMDSPLRIADLLQDPVGAPLPIRSDAFLEMWKRSLAQSLSVDPMAAGETLAVAPRPRSEWYNNATLWIIAGGLVGGAVLTYLLTREAPVRSQPGGVTFPVDSSP